MLKKIVTSTIASNNLLKSGDRVIAAVSGGPDSIAMLHLLSTIPKIKIYAVHLNHMLRGKDADRDEIFVKKICKQMSIPYFTKKIDVKKYAQENKQTIEEAGRNLRYSFFEEIAKNVKADKVALAHTADDNVETFLMRLVRGAGIRGLSSISVKRGKIIRPLIDVWKKDVLNYCRKNNLEFVCDKSNKSPAYLRNRIRNKLIPDLAEYNPRIKETLVSAIKCLSDDHEFISQTAQKAFRTIKVGEDNNGIVINRLKLQKLPSSIQNNILRLAIERIKGNLNDISFLHLKDIMKLESGILNLPHNIFIRCDKEAIIISNKSPLKLKQKSYSYRVIIPGEILIKETDQILKAKITGNEPSFKKIKKNLAYLDADKIRGELIARNFKKGDYFVPLGMSGRKKLHNFFIDEKIPIENRCKIPIIADDEKIVWIAGYRLSDEAKIDGGTGRIIKLSIFPDFRTLLEK